jgi:5-methylthioadenosine/S-adenosylhomocysteine deaminase
MATCDAARILAWDRALGALSAGLRADITGVAGTTGDPYTTLIDAADEDVEVVVVRGTPRYGPTTLMRTLLPAADSALETAVPGIPAGHAVNVHQASPDPAVGDLALADAAAIVGRALAALNGTSQAVMAAVEPLLPASLTTTRRDGAPSWRLALDEIQPTGEELRPRLMSAGGPAVPSLPADVADGLAAITIDALTASTDAGFLAELAQEMNLPANYGRELSALLA